MSNNRGGQHRHSRRKLRGRELPYKDRPERPSHRPAIATKPRPSREAIREELLDFDNWENERYEP